MVVTDFVNPTSIIASLGLKEGTHVGDFGAGSGAYVTGIAPLVGQTGRVYAVEVQKDVLLKLKQEGMERGFSNVTYIWTDFEHSGASGVPSNELDVAILSNTLFQLDDKLGALQEIYRTLKDGGRLYVIEWADSFKGLGPDADKIVTHEEARHLVRQGGFSIKREFAPGAHHYGLECIK